MKGERNEAGTKTSIAEKERGRNENVIYGKGTRQERKHKSRGTTNTLVQRKTVHLLVMGRVWKKSGLGGYGYTRIFKCLVRVCQVLEKSGSGGY